MPEIDLPSSHTASPVGSDLAWTLATMCFPNVTDDFWQLVKGLALDEIVGMLNGPGGDHISVPGDISRDLIGHVTPRETMQKDLVRARLHGTVAGLMLRWSVSRWRAGRRNEASKAKAAGVVHEWLKSSPDRRPARSSAVESWFDEYRSTAHLWAAWQLIDAAGVNAATPDGFRALVSTCHWLLTEGAQIVPPNSSAGPLLRTDAAWVLPVHLAGPEVIWSDDLDVHDIRQWGHPAGENATGQK